MTRFTLPPNPPSLRPLTDEQSSWLNAQHDGLPADTSQCVTCRGSRGFRWRHPEDPTQVVDFECPCEDQFVLHRVFLYSGIGVSYQRLGWGDFENLTESQAEAFNEYLEHEEAFSDAGIGLFVSGAEKGVGKTLYAALMLKRVIYSGVRDGHMTSFSELIDARTASWGSEARRERFARRIKNVGLLLIDDIGREYAGAKHIGDQALEEVLRHRAQHAKPTILTTNLDAETVARSYGGHTASVLAERSIVVQLSGQDFRPQQRQRSIGEVRAGLTRPIVAA
jgi:DNA replication protein DnaC